MPVSEASGVLLESRRDAPAGCELMGHGRGCSRKIPRSTLEQLIPLRELDQVGAHVYGKDIDDTWLIELAENARALTTSIDAIVPVVDDAASCGVIAASHSVSDIYASLSVPAWASVSLQVTSEKIRSGFAKKLTQSLHDAFSEMGIVYAGGHTLEGADSVVTISVTGIANRPPPRSNPVPGDQLVLSKPIGVGIALAAIEMGLIAEADADAEIESMRRSNAMAAEALSVEADSGKIRRVTDVSGFGLLDAVDFVRAGSGIELAVSKIPTFDSTQGLLADGAWSPLADHNLASAIRAVEFEQDSFDFPEQQLLLADPQTSGGLLAVATADAADRLIATSHRGSAFARIGAVIETSSDIASGFVRVTR